jgi:predicted PurR-regulated permease PerM
MQPKTFHDRFRQLIIFAVIVLLFLLLFNQLRIFVPGFLGAITLYILSHSLYNKLVSKRKWPKGITALLFIFVFLLMIAAPVFTGIVLMTPKIKGLVSHQNDFLKGFSLIIAKLESMVGMSVLEPQTMKSASLYVAGLLPDVLNGTALFVSNLLMLFFVYYFLLVSSTNIEGFVHRMMPLKKTNVAYLMSETRKTVRANALGIPLISLIQGLTAALGYWIFGLKDWALWGFMTGLFAFFPIVGTMIIWVPLVALLFAEGHTGQGTWLLLYSLLITGNIDYFARLTLMKKMGDVHPLVTILGVIVGLNLFGFIGLVFGPLLVSYFQVLVQIYLNEFSAGDSGSDSTHSTTET